MIDQRFKAGLVGAGYISEFHVRALRRLPHVQIAGICDVDPARAAAAAQKWELRAFSSLAELVNAGANVIHVLTPPASHPAVTLEALSLGCDVLVEKPLATSVEDCDRISEAAARAGKVVGVNHSLLHDPFISQALRRVRAGAVGDVLTVDYFRSSDYTPWRGGPLPPQYRDGGYPFRDLGVHALYLLQEFLGEIQNVQAEFRDSGARFQVSGFSVQEPPDPGEQTVEPAVSMLNTEHRTLIPSYRKRDPNLHFDEWRALVRCARGSGQIQLSWNVRPIQHQLFIQGTRGTLRADLFSMFVAKRQHTPLPKSIERGFNALNEARQIEFGTTGNALRFLRGKLLPYHGLQMLVEEFYQGLASRPTLSERGPDDIASGKVGLGETRPTIPTIADARPIVEWTERVAREADAAKDEWLKRFPTTLTAKVLVTGAAGFIGRHLVRRLVQEGQRVRVFVRQEPSSGWHDFLTTEARRHGDTSDTHRHSLRASVPSVVEIILGDLGDPEAVDRAVAGTELVYHVGAAMSGRPEDFQRGTVAGTRNVINSVLKHRVPKLVYVSSLSVLHAAAAKPGVKITEDWPLEPHPERRGAYTQTKLDAERSVSLAVKQRGLHAVILRPGQVFGPGAPLLTPAVARQMGPRLVILGDGSLALPLVYVDDVVDALLAAARSDGCDGSIFHIVDETGVTQAELARRVGRPMVHVPRPIVYALAAGLQLLGKLIGRAVPLTPYRVRSALAPISFDCSAARTRLGWRPQVGVPAGLERTLNSLRTW